MKKTVIAMLLMALSCTPQVEENILCKVTLNLSLPDVRNMVSLSIDPSLEGNIFQNLNTGRNYPYPLIVNNVGQITVLKGVYMLGFDGEAVFEDGSRAKVRFVSWNTPSTAVELLDDSHTLEIPLTILK